MLIKDYKCDEWYKKVKEKVNQETDAERVKLKTQKVDDEDLVDMQPLEGNEEETKRRERIKNFGFKQNIN